MDPTKTSGCVYAEAHVGSRLLSSVSTCPAVPAVDGASCFDAIALDVMYPESFVNEDTVVGIELDVMYPASLVNVDTVVGMSLDVIYPESFVNEDTVVGTVGKSDNSATDLITVVPSLCQHKYKYLLLKF